MSEPQAPYQVYLSEPLSLYPSRIRQGQDKSRIYLIFREKIGGEALLFVYYLDHKSFEKAEEVLEIAAFGNGGSDLSEIRGDKPYFGTIMRYGSDKFDDSLEIFKAAKQGQKQEKY